jgi:Na+/proline symporter
MFIPASPLLVIVSLILLAIAGMVIGGVSGLLISLFTKPNSQQVFRNALIGAFGFLVGFIGCFYLPWHQNTISYQLQGGTQVTSTTNFYQHPARIAAIVAIVLPLLYELNRARQARWKKP